MLAYGADSIEQLARQISLAQVTARANLEGLFDKSSGTVLAYKDDFGIRNQSSYHLGGHQPVHSWEADIQKDDVGLQLLRFGGRVDSILCLTSHRPIRLGCE